MKKIFIFPTTIMLSLLFALLMFDSKVYANDNHNSNYADDRVIISFSTEESLKFKDYSIKDFPEVKLSKIVDLTECNKNVIKNPNNGLIASKFNQTLCLYLNHKGFDNVDIAIKKLSKRDEIVAISPDYVMETSSTIPNDTYIEEQWALDNINLYDAWDITIGSSFLSVGVMDSGIQASHSDLSNIIDTNKSIVALNGNITVPTTVTDDSGHGTQAAGIMSAIGNNNNCIAGCNWKSKVASLKVFNQQGFGYSSDFILALNYANINNISILNFSGRWFANESTYNSPVDKAIANYTGLLVCAAGNDSTNIDNTICCPASLNFPNLITVGSIDINNQKSYFSNFGNNNVDLFAPGWQICSTNNDGSLVTRDGTSLAAPYVTGVASLIKSIRPDFSPQEIKQCILDNVDYLSNLSGYCKTGGKLNAYKALRAATEQQTFIADVNADGYNDMILSGKNSNNKRVFTTLLGNSNGNFSTENSFTSTRSFYYADRAYVGDFNGDSRSDILVMWNNGSYRQILVYLGNSSGTFNEAVNLSSTRLHNSYLYPYQSLVLDVNNDGCDDFVISYKGTNGKRNFLVYSGKSVSPYLNDATYDALNSNYDYFDDSKIYKGDFNGDNYDDIIVPTYNSNYKRQLITYLGNNSSTFSEGVILTSTRNHLPETFEYEYFVGDINGDSKSDFVNIFYDNGFRDSLTYKGTNTTPYVIDSIYDTMINCESLHSNEKRFIADVDGDGRDDLIIHYANSNNKRTFDIFKGNSNGNFEASVTTTTTNTHNPLSYPCSMYVSDINNDCNNDFIVKWKNGSGFTVYVYKGKSDFTFESCVSKYSASNFYLG